MTETAAMDFYGEELAKLRAVTQRSHAAAGDSGGTRSPDGNSGGGWSPRWEPPQKVRRLGAPEPPVEPADSSQFSVGHEQPSAASFQTQHSTFSDATGFQCCLTSRNKSGWTGGTCWDAPSSGAAPACAGMYSSAREVGRLHASSLTTICAGF